MFWNLPSINWILLWLARYYPFLFRTQRPGVLIASRGLGLRGRFPVPLDLWNKIVPSTLRQDLLSCILPEMTSVRPLSAENTAMLDRLFTDGFFLRWNGTPNCTLFTIAKTSEKCSLIADLRGLNKFSIPFLPKFSLPSAR